MNKKILNIFIFIVYSILLTFFIDCISRSSFNEAFNFLTNSFNIFLYNVLIIVLTLSPCFLFKIRLFYFSLISLIWFILALANNLVTKFRGMPLTFYDIGMIENGLEIIEQYLSKNLIIIMILSSLLLISLLIFIFLKCKKKSINYFINILLISLLIISFPQILNYGLKSNIISKNFWDINWGYNTYGFIYSFFNSAINNGINKPINYSNDTISSIKNSLLLLEPENDMKLTVSSSIVNYDFTDIKDFKDNDNKLLPNIILIQLESFINPNWITDIKLNKNPVSNLESLSNEFTSGLISVPVLGGGTANTEFEVITGMSTEFFGSGEFPYNTIASKKAIPSLAYTLRDLGYSSNSLHNHEGKFYSRDVVYQNLGFDSFTPIECMSPPERTPVGWAKDSVLIDEICNILISTDNSDLIFGISIQGHGGYPSDYIEDKEVYITNDYSKDNKNSLEYYINQIYEMDQFIGNLIETVNELNEPTIIVFYGDHFPAIGLSESNISIRTLKKTPYLIWDNMNLARENKDISAYELTSLILDKLSLPSTTLNMLHNSSLDEKTKTEYLNQLEYDMIYGKNYTADYEELVPSSEYKIGFKNVKINSIEIYDDNNILIKGENFNNYSNVYINGKYIEKISIDNNTLSIPLNYCKKGDKIQIRQDSTTDSTIFSYSNELTFK